MIFKNPKHYITDKYEQFEGVLLAYYCKIASFTWACHYLWCCHKTKQNKKVEKRCIKEWDKKIADLCWHRSHLTQRQLRHDEDLPLAQDLEVLHTLPSRERENKKLCEYVCVCVYFGTQSSHPVKWLLFSTNTPLISVHVSVLYIVFRKGTISDIKKTHTHTQLMACLCPCGWRNLEICEDRPRLQLTPEPGLVRDSLECDMTVSGAEQMEFLECFCWVPN